MHSSYNKFHLRVYLGEIGGLSVKSKTEEGTTSVTAIVTPGHSPGNHVYPKKGLGGGLNPKTWNRWRGVENIELGQTP